MFIRYIHKKFVNKGRPNQHNGPHLDLVDEGIGEVGQARHRRSTATTSALKKFSPSHRCRLHFGERELCYRHQGTTRSQRGPESPSLSLLQEPPLSLSLISSYSLSPLPSPNFSSVGARLGIVQGGDASATYNRWHRGTRRCRLRVSRREWCSRSRDLSLVACFRCDEAHFESNFNDGRKFLFRFYFSLFLFFFFVVIAGNSRKASWYTKKAQARWNRMNTSLLGISFDGTSFNVAAIFGPEADHVYIGCGLYE